MNVVTEVSNLLILVIGLEEMALTDCQRCTRNFLLKSSVFQSLNCGNFWSLNFCSL